MNRLAASLAIYVLVQSSAVIADGDEAIIQELRAQITALTQRLDAIEASSTTESQELIEVKKTRRASTWADKVKIGGDFRYRYETIDDQRRPSNRDRNRIRARALISAKISDRLKLGLGLASGGSDPLSTNQTLGNASSTKDINLDLAYFDWTLFEHTQLYGGKIKNPLFKPENNSLIWDGDLRPEGMYVRYDNGSLFANAGFNFLESDSGSSGTGETDEAYALQAGYRTAVGNGGKLLFGGTYVHIPTAGHQPKLDGECAPGDSNCFGNTLNPDGSYANDFQEIEAFAELHLSLKDKPLVLFADFVQNTDADDEDTGYSAGIRLGKAKNPGSWQISYIYQKLEADAVLGLFTDADFGGGGTDSKGHILKAAYGIAKNTQLKATFISGEYGEHTRGRVFDYERLQFDLSFKY